MTEYKPRILAIDDTPANLLTLGATLAADFDLQIATSGEMGLALARESAPDLILLDVMMPGMDGFETCQRLKADPKLAHIPVIFVTALSEITSEEKGLSLGAADYITKPLNIEVARQRIRNLLDRERFRKEIESQRDLLNVEIAERKQYEEKLADESHKNKMLLHNASDGIHILDHAGKVVEASNSFCQMLGYTRDEIIGMSVRQWDAMFQPDEVDAVIARQFEHSELSVFETRHRRKDGSVFEVEVTGRPLKFGDGMVLFNSSRDITERKHAENKLKLAASVFAHAREGIMITDLDGTIVEVNDAFSRITGYSNDEVVGCNPRILSSGRQSKEYYSAMWQGLVGKGHWYGEVWNRRKTGEVYAEMQNISTVRDADGQPQNYVALFSDITVAKKHQTQLEHIAHYDTLTDLPNRALLTDRLQQAMMQAERRGQPLVVAFIDLDGFKAINDTHGHEVGDFLLTSVASRMKDALREGDTLARIGGDEFIAVLVDLADSAVSEVVFSRLLAAASQPVYFNSLVLQISASIGVTRYPQADAVDGNQLIRQSDQAMYEAKMAGKNRCHIFDAARSSGVGQSRLHCSACVCKGRE